MSANISCREVSPPAWFRCSPHCSFLFRKYFDSLYCRLDPSFSRATSLRGRPLDERPAQGGRPACLFRISNCSSHSAAFVKLFDEAHLQFLSTPPCQCVGEVRQAPARRLSPLTALNDKGHPGGRPPGGAS